MTLIDRGALFFSLNEPRDPDAALVKQTKRQRHRDHGEHVRRRADDGGENEQEHDRVRPGALHEFVTDEAEANQGQDHNRQLEGETEGEGEASDERIIFLHSPRRRPPEVLGVAKEKQNRFRQEPVVRGQDAGEKESEADEDRGEQKTFFHRGERGQNKFREEIKQQRKRDDDAGIESESERDRERISDGESAQRADSRVDLAQRTLHDVNQGGAKAEEEDNSEDERDGHFHDRPAQVLEMRSEERRRFALGQVPKSKDVSQPHDSAFAEGEQTAGEQPRTNCKRVGVANHG